MPTQPTNANMVGVLAFVFVGIVAVVLFFSAHWSARAAREESIRDTAPDTSPAKYKRQPPKLVRRLTGYDTRTEFIAEYVRTEDRRASVEHYAYTTAAVIDVDLADIRQDATFELATSPTNDHPKWQRLIARLDEKKKNLSVRMHLEFQLDYIANYAYDRDVRPIALRAYRRVFHALNRPFAASPALRELVDLCLHTKVIELSIPRTAYMSREYRANQALADRLKAIRNIVSRPYLGEPRIYFGGGSTYEVLYYNQKHIEKDIGALIQKARDYKARNFDTSSAFAKSAIKILMRLREECETGRAFRALPYWPKRRPVEDLLAKQGKEWAKDGWVVASRKERSEPSLFPGYPRYCKGIHLTLRKAIYEMVEESAAKRGK